MLHWSLATSCGSKASKKMKRKRPPTQHWSNALCIYISLLHIPHHNRHITTKIPLKESKESWLWCSRPLPSAQRSPLHFSQPLVLHRWGEGGVRDEKLSGLCIQAPSQFSILVSASRHLLTSVSSLHSGTFSILNSGLCIQAPSHICLVSAFGHLLNSQCRSMHPGTFSHQSRLCIGTFSSGWSLDRNLLTQGSLNYTCRFTI